VSSRNKRSVYRVCDIRFVAMMIAVECPARSLPTVRYSRKNVSEIVSVPALRYRPTHLGPTERASLSDPTVPPGDEKCGF
jgi:hypothetical protein